MTSLTARHRIVARTTAVVATGLAGVAVLTGTASTATASAAPADALLRASEMPVVNEVQDWHRVDVRGRVSAAQTQPLSALGATERARRDFRLAGSTARASSVVLSFDSVAEADEAFAEVKSWRRHTGDNVPDEGRLLFTSKPEPVDVERGRGSYFSFVYKTDRDSDEGVFEWLGVTRRGATVAIVSWNVGGQDATYDTDPTIASVQRANEKLARLG